jgi:hypothetical protein
MPLRVLVIDPNAAASTLVNETLGREGYEVATAASLDEGLSRFNEMPADLVLLSGAAEPERLEGWWREGAGDALKHTPILVLGEGTGDVVPAAGNVPTPIDADDLVAQVRTQVGAPEPTGNLAWLPDALREASDEIADMERLLGWPGGPAPAPGAGAEAAALAEGQDPVSLGIFTEDEVQGARPSAEPEPSEAGETPEAAEAAQGEETAEEALEAARAEDAKPAPKGPASKVRPQPAAPIAGIPPEQVALIVADIAREAVERVVWETVPSIVARYISQNRDEQERLFTQLVERVVWETVPEIAESQVRTEIRRISEGGEA